MENQQEPKNQDEIKISKKNLYIAGGIILGILGIGGGYLALNKGNNPQGNGMPTDSLAITKDSVVAEKDSLQDIEEGEYDGGYAEYRIIAKDVTLPDGQKLKFGDVVYKDYDKSSASTSVIYLNNPRETPSTTSYPISISEDMIINEYDFDDYKDKFSLHPYSSLPASVKKLLVKKEGYYEKNDRRYFITQNEDRAKSTLTIGDFDGDGVKDYAVVLDDNERQESLIMIIAINKATKAPYVAYSDGYSDKLKIKSFAKGASIYMNSDDFVKAPREGVLMSGEYGSLAIVYDSKAQKFKVYDQTPTELPSAEAEE